MLYLKALHIIFVVTWFAGLFYFVRLLVYHVEAESLPETERATLQRHFKGAERRLWYGITWPSAILTWIFGLWLAYSYYGWDFPAWLHTKLLFVIGLTVYHLWCGSIHRSIVHGNSRWNSTSLRIWNEVATLFLVAVVFLVVMKDQLEWIKGVIGLVVFSVVMMAAISIYKRLRERK